MRAIAITEAGGPEVLNLTEVDVPEPGDGQLRIDVAAAGVNFIDTYQRSGLYPLELPFTPGVECAGVVSAVGADSSEFAVGDRVAITGVPGCASVDKALVVGSEWVGIGDEIVGGHGLQHGRSSHFEVDTGGYSHTTGRWHDASLRVAARNSGDGNAISNSELA